MSTSRRWPLELARVAALVVAVAMHALLAVSLAQTWSTPEALRRDYVAFHDAGRRAQEGRLEGLYDHRPSGFPFLHPPPVIALSVPLALLPPRAAFVAITLVSFAAIGLFAFALRRLAPRPGEHDAVFLGVLASAPWGIALVLGQPAPLALAVLVAAILARQRRRPLLAGLLFGALLLKPTLAIAPLAFMLVARERRMLAGFGLAAAIAFAISLPLGLERWSEWAHAALRAGADVSDARVLLWKQHTWLAWLRSVLPSAALAWTGWALVALPLGVGVLARLRRPARLGALRTGALLALATIALAPYAYFYDAILLALPAAALWLERHRYPRRAHLALVLLATLTFAWEHVGFFMIQGGPALGGLLVTLWLAVEGMSADTNAVVS